MEKRELCLNLMRVVSDSEILSNRSVMSAATALLSISEVGCIMQFRRACTLVVIG